MDQSKPQPLIAVYSETNHLNIHERLGKSEYSYYFVVKAFVPFLRELGEVVVVTELEPEVRRLQQQAADSQRPFLFLFFAPPHRMVKLDGVPTVPVIAWEFDLIPTETWDDNPYNDWRVMLAHCGAAITHSGYAEKAIRRAMGPDFKLVSIPAPVWDHYARMAPQDFAPRQSPRSFEVSGELFDSLQMLPDYTPEIARQAPTRQKYLKRRRTRRRSREQILARLKSLIGISTPEPSPHHLQLNGTVYASILNPRDSRKNWVDMTSAFVGAFRDRTDVTLLLKFNEHSSDDSFSQLEFLLRRNLPMKCRVIAFNGYLDDENFSSFLASINYVVNASSGEGQCLPLMELMSMGTPALAPLNTSMEDYVTPDNAFIVRSELEPAIWPQDTRAMVRGHQYRISWQSLCEAFQQSKDVIDTQPARYAAMGRQAREVLKQHCSHAIAVERMRGFIASLHL